MNEEINSERPGVPADQRRSLRVPLLVQKVRLDDGKKAFFGYAKNISRSGMFIATANPREPGSRFQVEIPLPKSLNRTVQTTCEVVWQRQFSKKSTLDPGMGLQFIDLPQGDCEAIDAWVKELEEKGAGSAQEG